MNRNLKSELIEIKNLCLKRIQEHALVQGRQSVLKGESSEFLHGEHRGFKDGFETCMEHVERKAFDEVLKSSLCYAIFKEGESEKLMQTKIGEMGLRVDKYRPLEAFQAGWLALERIVERRAIEAWHEDQRKKKDITPSDIAMCAEAPRRYL